MTETAIIGDLVMMAAAVFIVVREARRLRRRPSIYRVRRLPPQARPCPCNLPQPVQAAPQGPQAVAAAPESRPADPGVSWTAA